MRGQTFRGDTHITREPIFPENANDNRAHSTLWNQKTRRPVEIANQCDSLETLTGHGHLQPVKMPRAPSCFGQAATDPDEIFTVSRGRDAMGGRIIPPGQQTGYWSAGWRVIQIREVGAIGRGILALVGVERGDTEAQAARLAERVLGYRIFQDAGGKMNLSLLVLGAAGSIGRPRLTQAPRGSRCSLKTIWMVCR